MDINFIIGALALATAVVGYAETRFRMSGLSVKVKAEVKADATLAAAIVLAEALRMGAEVRAAALLAAEKIKSDAKGSS